jgi:hypothetical protein
MKTTKLFIAVLLSVFLGSSKAQSAEGDTDKQEISFLVRE